MLGGHALVEATSTTTDVNAATEFFIDDGTYTADFYVDPAG